MHAYLDCAATTPVRPEVREAILPFFEDHFANPSGAHYLARRARDSLEEARERIADLLGVTPGEVVFTSGGTEADNLAVSGVLAARGGTAVCSSVEHHAVLDAVLRAGGRSVPVDRHGLVQPDVLARVLRETSQVSLVSVMAVNNETGVVQPVPELVETARRHARDSYFHVDAVQAHCWMDLAPLVEQADLVSLSAHKFGGPKGVGVLVVRKGVRIEPMLVGGGQERGLRSGTQNVAGAVGMAEAAALAADERQELVERATAMRGVLYRALVEETEGVVYTVADPGFPAGDQVPVVPGIFHVCIDDVVGEELLFLLEREGVYASVASSCSSGAGRPSHVLEAMGVDPEKAKGALRLSLGWSTMPEEVEHAAKVVPEVVRELRSRRKNVFARYD